MIEEELDKVASICIDIDREAMLQNQNRTPGYTAVKDKQREELEAQLFRMGSRMLVYARSTGDGLVAAQVKFKRSKLSDMSLNDLLTTARTVVDTAMRLGVILETYKVFAEDVADLTKAIDATDLLNARRNAAKGEGVSNTSRLTELFAVLHTDMKQLDTLVDAYVEDEEFAKAYFSTRRIHDVKGGSKRKVVEEEI